MEDNPANNILPYQFEPEWPADEHEEAHQFEDNEDQEFVYIEDESRRDNLEWCQCGNCQIMDNNEECLCCKEISNICDKNVEAVETNETTEVPCALHNILVLSLFVLTGGFYKQIGKSTSSNMR
ncbi:uncharacterized protein LOC124438915 [Xenia sp. Carnegie-2017]|uniref:uncharacterized protein LOC124438915 n=1 Tax=Xenia sp. Carnegie-2017 TaxID=2897299 RepID=UPI001F0387F4|nr:uncharacterized protein LOC124438915 [Xenia sp. Carnegie-2017]